MTRQLRRPPETQDLSRESPTVSVVLLSYNRPDYLRQAVASIRAQSYRSIELIVVDNPSPSSAEIAETVAAQGNVRLIRSSVNSGYAGGMNRGIESAAGRYIYLTEDDIVLDKDCIRHLVEYAKERQSGGLVSPVMYNKTEGTIRCAGGEFALGAVYRRRTHGEGERDTGQFARPFNVTYIDGATMFARADLFRRLGGFREEYFMYVEAVEFCARALKAEQTLTVIPRARVYHFEPPADANASANF
ncbi:MAG: glycosyltransferase family 2 protein, partial [Rubrivivax sp.]|nr:glycosyltransferase family 2 protein [Pyrinomonadaceae bacterium]